MRISIRGIKLAAFLCFCGIFVTSSALRSLIIPYSSALYKFDLLTYIGFFLVIYFDRKLSYESAEFFHKDAVVFYAFAVFIIAFIFTLNGTWRYWYGGFISIVLPSIIIFYKFYNKYFFWDFFEVFIVFLRIAVIVIYIGIVIDVVNGFIFSKTIAVLSGNYYLVRMAMYYKRTVTFFGHPLFSTEILLAFYVFNHIYVSLIGKKDGVIPFVLAGVGIAFCQSKTGIALILIAFILFNINIDHVVTIISAVLFGYVLYHMGLFDGVISRFTIDLAQGDITSGRNSLLKKYLSNGLLDFHLLEGHPYNPRVVTPLEYPILRWAYLMGGISAVLLMFMYFIIPMIKLIHCHKRDILIAFVIISVDVNTYSSLGDSGNYPIFFCILVCILLNLGYFYDDFTCLRERGNKE